MFWRVLFQLVRVSRTRLLLALAAVVCGAAVISALLNIHFDAEHKLTQEFTALGPNVVIAPKRDAADGASPLLDASVESAAREAAGQPLTSISPALYVVARVQQRPVIVAGSGQMEACLVGNTAAQALNITPGSRFEIQYAQKTFPCVATMAAASGGQEDNQISISLRDAQALIGQPGKVSLIRVRVSGPPQVITETVSRLSAALPALDVRAIRQIAQAEGQILGRIRGLIFATVVLILVLTALCVLSAMTALAMEHRRDVGLMKALGGEMHRVLRLFLCEILAVGFTGALLGWLCGIALSAWVGRQVFAASISPRPEVLPLTVALMTAVALAGAFPLRLLSRVRPGVILRGE